MQESPESRRIAILESSLRRLLEAMDSDRKAKHMLGIPGYITNELIEAIANARRALGDE